jgi:hypothetical protein
MRSLHYVHEMNADGVGHDCLSVRMIQLGNCWMHLDEIWCGYYAIGIYTRIAIFNVVQSNTKMADEQTFEVGSTLTPFALGPYNE